MIITIDVYADESDTEALQRELGGLEIVEILSVRTRLLPPGVTRQLVVGVPRDDDEALERFMNNLLRGQTADPPSSHEPGGSTPWTPPQRTGLGTVP